MIITRFDRDLYHTVSDRSARLRALLADPHAAAKIGRAGDQAHRFLAHWAGVDRGPLTDPEEIRHGYRAQSKALAAVRRALLVAPKTAGGTGDVPAWLGIIFDPVGTVLGAAWDAATEPSPDVERAVRDCASAWNQLEPQMHAHAELAKQLEPLHADWTDFYAKWQDGDRDVTRVNPVVEETNTARAIAGGFVPEHDPNPVRGIDIEQANPLLSAGAAADNYCKENADSLLCTATKPDASWCQRLGVSDTICDKDGLKPWFLWSLGLGGAALVGGVVYAAYKAAKVAAPIALAVGAPELLPAYAAIANKRYDELPGHLANAQMTKRGVYPQHVARAVDAQQAQWGQLPPVPASVPQAATTRIALSPEAAKYTSVRYT